MVAEYFIRNADFLKAWDAAHDSEFYTEAYQKKVLEQDEKNFFQGQSLRYWLMPENENVVIGNISFNNIVMDHFAHAFSTGSMKKGGERAYDRSPEEKRIETAFGPLGLHRIEANIIPRNRASLRVAENFISGMKAYPQNI